MTWRELDIVIIPVFDPSFKHELMKRVIIPETISGINKRTLEYLTCRKQTLYRKTHAERVELHTKSAGLFVADPWNRSNKIRSLYVEYFILRFIILYSSTSEFSVNDERWLFDLWIMSYVTQVLGQLPWWSLPSVFSSRLFIDEYEQFKNRTKLSFGRV